MMVMTPESWRQHHFEMWKGYEKITDLATNLANHALYGLQNEKVFGSRMKEAAECHAEAMMWKARYNALPKEVA